MDYYFVSEAEFEAEVARGEFLEHARVHGNLYGTHRRLVEEQVAAGKTVILDIDVQGAAQVRASGTDAAFVFVLPPSFEVLEQRLRSRGTDSEDVIAGRLAVARSEMSQADLFDHRIINDVLDTATEEFVAAIAAERHRRRVVSGA